MCWGGSLLFPELPGMGIGCGVDQCVGGNWLENSIHCIGWDTEAWRGLETQVWDVSSSGDLFLFIWFAALSPRVYLGSQLHKLFPNSKRSLFTQHRQINSSVTLTRNCLLLIRQTWHITKGYCGNLSYNLAPLHCFKSLTLETFNFEVLFELPLFLEPATLYPF